MDRLLAWPTWRPSWEATAATAENTHPVAQIVPARAQAPETVSSSMLLVWQVRTPPTPADRAPTTAHTRATGTRKGTALPAPAARRISTSPSSSSARSTRHVSRIAMRAVHISRKVPVSH